MLREGHFETQLSPASLWLVIVITMGALLPRASQAIIFESTGSATHNIAAPTGDYLNSGWQYEGYYGGFLGTMISPQFFITAQHMGPQGSSFVHAGVFNGGADITYTIDTSANGGLGYFDIANSDLRLIKINEWFPYYAPLYTSGNEQGLTLMVTGRGGPRGADVIVSGLTHGWEHTAADGIARWGSNVVSDVTTIGIGEMLVADFSLSGTLHEATLSVGDSGGGVFVNDGGIWKLAGINYSVDGYFDTNDTIFDSSEFGAALTDRGGLYQGNDGDGWSLIPNIGPDIPSNFYASRIATQAVAIQTIAAVPEPHGIVLLSSAALLACLRRRRS